jgi:hypothetical protein
VDTLFDEFISCQVNPRVTRDGLRLWYNGYHTKSGESVYNPRSVVASLSNNNLGSYWTSSGPYDEIYYYINDMRVKTSIKKIDCTLKISHKFMIVKNGIYF